MAALSPPDPATRRPGVHMDTYRRRNRNLELWLAMLAGLGITLALIWR